MFHNNIFLSNNILVCYFLSIDFASSLDDSPFTSNALMDEETLTHRPNDIKNIVCSPYINV